MSILHPTWIEIDLSQFKKNIQTIRNYIGKCLYCLPVKANAYGHGLCAIGKAAEEEGVDYLAVAHLQEGILLRNAGIKIPILILGAIHENQILAAIDADLELTISSHFKANLVEKICEKYQKKCLVHLEVDTGMQRTGMRPDTGSALFQKLQKSAYVKIHGIYSHFATADTPDDLFAKKQINSFKQMFLHPNFQAFSGKQHMCNSSGMIFFKDAHFDMVRPSLATFGYLPDLHPEELNDIAPCFSLKSKVSYFKVVSEGQGISYGHRFVAPKMTRVVTVPIGYGDGFRRSLSNIGSVLIRGKRFPIVGTICMDQFMVDIGNSDAYVGDEVVLIGRQGEHEITIQEMAKLIDTVPYEILCLFNERIPRVYL